MLLTTSYERAVPTPHTGMLVTERQVASDFPEGRNVTRESERSFPLEAYFLPTCVTLIGCVLALCVTLKGKVSQQSREATYFVVSLIVSVFLLSSLSLIYLVVLLSVPEATLGDSSACYVKLFQRILSAVYCFSLACVALDRYLAICWPLRYADLLTKTRSLLLIACSWLAPFLLLLLVCVADHSTLCLDGRNTTPALATYAALYFLGASCTVVLYVLVAFEFCRSRGALRLVAEAAEFDKRAKSKTTASALMAATLCFFSIPHTVVPFLNPGLLPISVIRVIHLLNRLHIVLFLPVHAKSTFKAVCGMLATCLLHVWGRCNSCCRSAGDGSETRFVDETM
ncbi:olfactory receptor 510-like [Penaeus chinensis]|uniref:olfactory receptor 510-like n=1 Tax=Penaeus chinensis TaxID=139456 RepID=UPI001FB65176|nr:olfactory receptor 510-like [Penaeus chinensis]